MAYLNLEEINTKQTYETPLSAVTCFLFYSIHIYNNLSPDCGFMNNCTYKEIFKTTHILLPKDIDHISLL